MRKINELQDPNSCLNKAKPREMLFVLIGHDVCGPEVIRFWCEKRIERGKNKPGDPQIREALLCAIAMEEDQERARAASPVPGAEEKS
jgi:hypothetical protein